MLVYIISMHNETQLQIFREILEIVTDLSRIVSIHSYWTTRLLVRECVENLSLYWFFIGGRVVWRKCYFSVHSAVARQKFRMIVPPKHILIESDHGYADPPIAILRGVEWVEHLLAQQLGLSKNDIRRLAWQNLQRSSREQICQKLLSKQLIFMAEVSCDIAINMQ